MITDQDKDTAVQAMQDAQEALQRMGAAFRAIGWPAEKIEKWFDNNSLLNQVLEGHKQQGINRKPIKLP